MIIRYVPSALLVLTFVLGACKKPVVESYQTPKEVAAAPRPAIPADHHHAGVAPGATGGPAPAAPASAPAGSSMANTAVPTSGGSALTWKAPAHWQAKAGSAMRKGSFAVKAAGVPGEADLSITAFPGDVGGDLANLNRWRNQINLPPVTQAEFASAVQKLEKNGLKMTVVDLGGTGDQAQRILGAMIPYEGSTWFVKMTGPDGLVAKEKTAFMEFLDTVAPAPTK